MMEEWEQGYWDDEEEDEFCGRECYEFNNKLKEQFDDDCCEHCMKYLTLQCAHLEDFMDELSDMGDYD
jgi:hypothetical protein